MKLRTPAVRCPKCGSPPPLRITDLVQATPDAPADAVLLTIRCGASWCGAVYPVTVAACRAAA